MKMQILAVTVAAFYASMVAFRQSAQDLPAAIQAPVDQQLYLQVHAVGVQIYSCKSQSGQFGWILKGPEARLTDIKGKAFGKHFAGPTWQSYDGSSVTGTMTAKVDSGDADSIPWLLVNVTSHQGSGVLSRAKSIQRINTKGGKPPGSGCDANHADQETRVDYSADYNFYAAR